MQYLLAKSRIFTNLKSFNFKQPTNDKSVLIHLPFFLRMDNKKQVFNTEVLLWSDFSVICCRFNSIFPLRYIIEEMILERDGIILQITGGKIKNLYPKFIDLVNFYLLN